MLIAYLCVAVQADNWVVTESEMSLQSMLSVSA